MEDKKGYPITYGWMAEFLESISKNDFIGFYPTGSAYFGLETNESDLDFIVKRETWNGLHKEAHQFHGKNNGMIDGEYEFENLKLLYKDEIFNFIIVPDDKEYKIWVQTTKSFLLLLENRILRKILNIKEKRIEVFELLKEKFREYYNNDLFSDDIPF